MKDTTLNVDINKGFECLKLVQTQEAVRILDDASVGLGLAFKEYVTDHDVPKDLQNTLAPAMGFLLLRIVECYTLIEHLSRQVEQLSSEAIGAQRNEHQGESKPTVLPTS
jgi:hypothetical protein